LEENMSLTLRLQALMGFNDITAAHRAAAALSWMYSYPVARRIVRECYQYPNGVSAAQYAVQKSLESAEAFFGKDFGVAVIESEPQPCLWFEGTVVRGRDSVNRANYEIRSNDLRISASIGVDKQFFYLIVPREAAHSAKSVLYRHRLVSIGA
jgi:hypothetical protein